MTAVAGVRAVARMADLPPVEARIVDCLRAWSEDAGPGSRTLRALTRGWVPIEQHHAWCERFDQLVTLILLHARRPPARHAGGCPCVGADEAVFAHLAHLAATGEREDAMLVATLLVRPDVAPMVVGLAQAVCLGLMPRSAAPRPARAH